MIKVLICSLTLVCGFFSSFSCQPIRDQHHIMPFKSLCWSYFKNLYLCVHISTLAVADDKHILQLYVQEFNYKLDIHFRVLDSSFSQKVQILVSYWQAIILTKKHWLDIQGARGIVARFLKWSPASALVRSWQNFHGITPTPPAT
jgi:hypothetical protein